MVVMMRNAFPDVQWTIEELVAEGQKVASSGTWQGTHQGVFLGILAIGKRVMVPFIALDVVVDGKLKDSRLMMNVMSFMQQLGVIAGSGQ